jgi:hypothetical protein
MQTNGLVQAYLFWAYTVGLLGTFAVLFITTYTVTRVV